MFIGSLSRSEIVFSNHFSTPGAYSSDRIGQSSGRDHANDLPVWALFADVPDSRLSGDPIQPGSAAVGEQVLRAHCSHIGQ